MRIRELLEQNNLVEAPLPDDWEQSQFNTGTTFKKMVAYAKERAEAIGKGSSRVAFTIPYQGRDTVLKVAMNRKGLAQNQAEADLMDDGYVSSMGIVIPLIDYDTQDGRVSWIHTEKAQKISQNQLESFFGNHRMTTVMNLINLLINEPRTVIPERLQDNDYFHTLRDLVQTFDLPIGDFVGARNWGLYKGEPVIIDIGFTKETAKLYSRKN